MHRRRTIAVPFSPADGPEDGDHPGEQGGDASYRNELGFLLIASAVGFVIPVSGQISLVLGFALLGLFVFYLWKASRAGASEPDLVGPAARIGDLSRRPRRLLVTGLFVVAAAVIVASAEPFAQSLITTGTQLGIDRFLLVQWVAPLAYLAGGGGTALVLDGRQVEEVLLTATQTLLGVAALLTLRFPRWLALTLLGLFAVQYAVPGQAGRYLLCAVYGGIALVALVRNRRHLRPALAAPFRGAPDPGEESVLAPVRPLSPQPDRESAAGIQLTRILGGNDGGMTPPISWSPGPATAVLEVPARTQVTAPGRPAVLPVPGRSLVLVAGLPGAGKTTLLRTLEQDRAVRVSDSDPLRAAVLRLIPRGTRYGIVRPAVHLLHRSAVSALALGPAPVVVVHLPATSARLRCAVIWLARLSRRTPHLVWLDAAPAEARDGQRIRGRAITSRSFGRHVRRARRTSEQLLAGELSEGWATTLRLDRQSARHGLRIEMRPGRSRLSS